MSGKRYIISGGGTGGHIYPAIAIADELKRRNAESEILFVGAIGKMEMEKVPKAGYKIEGLNIAGFKRSIDWSNFSLPFKVWMSLKKAGHIIKRFDPDAVIGTGGFASGPVLFKAAGYKIPTLIQEQNSYPGVTNKILAKRVSKICVAFENMESYFSKDKLVLTGNPVRTELLTHLSTIQESRTHFNLDENKPTILVVGGSLGAKGINEAILKHIDQFELAGVQLLWQTGKPFFERASQSASQKQHIEVREFIYDMGAAYQAADLIISRAGAIAISELCLIGKPSILVPYPHATGNHQYKNALSLVQADAAILIEDKEASEQLVDKAIGLLNDNQHMQRLSSNIKLLSKPEALSDIVDQIESLNE